MPSARSRLAAVMVAGLACPAHAETLMSQSYGGTVSVSPGLTMVECDKARRLLVRAADLARIQPEYDRLMAKQWKEYYDVLAWRKAHPQCKHVDWWVGSSNNGNTTTFSKEDLSGKNGNCSVDGHGPLYRGTDDDIVMWNPDTNPTIPQIARDESYTNLGFPAPGQDGKPGDIKSAECF